MPKPQPVIALRKPPMPTNPAAAEAFVRGEPDLALQTAPEPEEESVHAAAPAAESLAPAAVPTPIITPPEETPISPVVEAKPAATEPVTVPRRRTIVKRKDGRSLYRTTVYLAPELGQKLAIRCVTENCTQSELIAAALREYL